VSSPLLKGTLLRKSTGVTTKTTGDEETDKKEAHIGLPKKPTLRGKGLHLGKTGKDEKRSS
jgi:hypothetical protein